jgi:hypothetical protein
MVARVDEMDLEVVPPGIVDKAKINAVIQQQQKQSTVDCTKRDIGALSTTVTGDHRQRLDWALLSPVIVWLKHKLFFTVPYIYFLVISPTAM